MLKKIFNYSLIGFLALSTFLSGVRFTQASTDYTGQIIKTTGLSSIYYVASDGKRYVFPNEKIYKSWFPDFSDIQTISYNELISLTLAGNVTYRPGVILVKITTDPKIYAVSSNGTLHWIETEEIAKELYGNNWNLLVDDLPDAFFANYNIGDSINNASD